MNISRKAAFWFCIIIAIGLVVTFVVQLFPEKMEPPAVEYGEFPFKVVYEVNGETMETEDTLVFEYNGVGWNEGVGTYYQWNTRFLSEKECPKETPMLIPLYREEDINGNEIAVCFVLGDFAYYMENGRKTYGDKGYSVGDMVLRSTEEERLISEEELYLEYGIKILEKSLPAPNSYET